ncbi:MAG: hypothetical protein ACOCQD_05265 [archaeon]
MTLQNNVYIRDEMKSLFKMFEYARWYPAWGYEHILGLGKLPHHQIKILRDIWYHDNIIELCSRRTGKTWIAGGVAPILQCILFPFSKIGIVGPNFRIAKLSFEECEKIYNKSAFVRAMTKSEPKHGSSSWTLEFTNGSKIESTPMGNSGDSVRGKGYSYIMFDEYNFANNPNEIVDNVLVPMLFTKRDINLEHGGHPNAQSNKLIIASTAKFAGMDYHLKVQEYDEKIKQGNKKYCITSFDVEDGLDSQIFDNERVLNEYNSVDEIVRRTEYENIFIDGSSGFIGYDLLQKKAIDKETSEDSNGNVILPKTRIEFKGEEGYEYILAFDDADTYDSFVISLIKLDGKTRRLVRIIEARDVHVSRKEMLIRELYRDFNIVRIIADQRHRNVSDALASPFKMPDGTMSPAILKREGYEDELDRIKYEYGEDVPFELVIDIHNFTAETNEYRSKLFRGTIEKGRFKIPSKISVDSKKEEEAYSEIEKGINQVISIIPKANGRYIKYDTPSKSFHKDYFTVMELSNYCAEEYLKNNYDDDSNIYIGGWRR